MMNINPFRYPGGKYKLLPIIMEHLNPLLNQSYFFSDAFVGGGSVLLEVAKQYPKHQLYVNDKDYWIYSYYKVISNSNQTQLRQLCNMLNTQPTLDLFYKLREIETKDLVECAYRAIFYNRCSFSGIFTAGPIGGKGQYSKYKIDCRYNSTKLKEQIYACNKLLSGRVTVENCDYSNYKYLVSSNYPIYLDPPYYIKGDGLYKEKMSKEDHKNLFTILENRKNWLLSYDNCKEIKELYKNNQVIDLSARYCIKGRKNTWETKKEILITQN